MQLSIHHRLDQLILEIGPTKNKFAQLAGLSSAQISHMTKGQKNFGVLDLLKILTTYPIISSEFICRGEGPMFRDVRRDAQASEFYNKPDISQVTKPQPAYKAGYIEHLERRVEFLEAELRRVLHES